MSLLDRKWLQTLCQVLFPATDKAYVRDLLRRPVTIFVDEGTKSSLVESAFDVVLMCGRMSRSIVSNVACSYMPRTRQPPASFKLRIISVMRASSVANVDTFRSPTLGDVV